MKKQEKPLAKRPARKKKTKGVGLRLKLTTIDWVQSETDEDGPTVPAKVRQWVEEREEEAKRAGG